MSDKELDRIKKYIENVTIVLNKLEQERHEDERVKKVIELCKSYCSDAKFYFEKGERITSLACIAYAEGLLDCLKFLNMIKFEWENEDIKKRQNRVLVTGTFDIIHPGHIWLMKKAKEYGRVIVIVATDNNVNRFKGRKPIIPSSQRLEVVRSIKYVDEAILGSDDEDILRKVEEIKPNIIILGPDQKFISEEDLKNKLKERGLNDVKVIRINEEYKESPFYKTSQIINEILRRREEFEKYKNTQNK
ncbi:MAG: cytidylyltransferase family protein [Candidatus Verstraetearchaeota archaeon]|jgi:FAD synthetase|nr:cytidylyltransferase family protein [Candidatus Verstraetearchaeota archaeon]